MSIAELNRHFDESRRLEALHSFDVLDAPREQDFDDIAKLASDICGTPIAVVNFIGEARQFFMAEVGLGVRETPFDSSFCAKAILEDEFLMVPDARRDSRFDSNPLVTGAPNLRFYAGAILKTSDDLPIGTVCVLDYEPRELNEMQQRALRVLARQVMIQLELRKTLRAQAHAIEVERRLGARRLARVAESENVTEQLRLDETRLRSAQAAGRVGTFELDVATSIVTISEEFCRIFGVPVQKTYPLSVFEACIVPEDLAVSSEARSRLSGMETLDVDYRIRRANDGSLRWISRRGRFVEDNSGVVERMSGVVFDTTEAKLKDAKTAALLRLGDELRIASSSEAIKRVTAEIFAEGLGATRAGFSTLNPSTNSFEVEYDWVAQGILSVAGTRLFPAAMAQLEDADAVVVEDTEAERWRSSDSEAYASIGVRSFIKVPMLKNGKLVAILLAHDELPRNWTKDEVDFGWGVADRAYAAIAKLEAEVEQEVLNQELSHRLKNTLSVVQAIAGQTLKNVTERDAVEAFTGRLQALSSAHDVLLKQSWTSARLSDVVQKVLSLHLTSDRLHIDGPDLALGPKVGLSMSLLLHELATNAQKYGALSNDKGSVSLTWRLEPRDSVPTVYFTWREAGGPTIGEPTRRGFGSRLIHMGIAGTGNLQKTFDPSGLLVFFHAPLALMQESGT